MRVILDWVESLPKTLREAIEGTFIILCLIVLYVIFKSLIVFMVAVIHTRKEAKSGILKWAKAIKQDFADSWDDVGSIIAVVAVVIVLILFLSGNLRSSNVVLDASDRWN